MKDKWEERISPKWAVSFLSWICPATLYKTIEGDSIEQFEIDVKEVGIKERNEGCVE